MGIPPLSLLPVGTGTALLPALPPPCPSEGTAWRIPKNRQRGMAPYIGWWLFQNQN